MTEQPDLPPRSFFNADDLSLLIMEHPDAPQFLAVKIADEHDAAMAQSLARIDALEAEVARLRGALQGLHDDVVEYVTLNKLHDADGSPAINNHWMKRARAALAGDAG